MIQNCAMADHQFPMGGEQGLVGDATRPAADSCPRAMGIDPPAPHRANKLLTFAVLSYVVCFGFAVAVVWMARHDLREMDAGRMDRSGRNPTEAARVVAVANLWLHVVMGFLIVAVTALILAREYYR